MQKPSFILFGATGALAKNKILPVLSNIDAHHILYSRHPAETSHKNVIGELEEVEKLKKEVGKNPHFFLALPPTLYGKSIDLIGQTFNNPKIALEKPFGMSLSEAYNLASKIDKIGQNNFYLVDHYMAKEGLITSAEKIKPSEVAQIKAVILEKGSVEGRTNFYDVVGAIKDVGQSHLVNMIARVLGPDSKEQVLKNLKHIPGSLTLGQYKDYKKAETYFSAEFKYKNIKVILETGKAMGIDESFLEITYKNGEVVRYEIGHDPLAHQKIIEDFLSGENKYALTVGEAIGAWQAIDPVVKARDLLLSSFDLV